eukprot:3185450-Prymnesium_polylepis.1
MRPMFLRLRSWQRKNVFVATDVPAHIDTVRRLLPATWRLVQSAKTSKMIGTWTATKDWLNRA